MLPQSQKFAVLVKPDCSKSRRLNRFATISSPLMANIAPFRALRYDQSKVALNDTITQPYDKITPEMQENYYAASPYNLVRIILGNLLPTDKLGDDRYSRAASSFSDWRKQGIFVQ